MKGELDRNKSSTYPMTYSLNIIQKLRKEYKGKSKPVPVRTGNAFGKNFCLDSIHKVK